jgi:hypothetical protein
MPIGSETIARAESSEKERRLDLCREVAQVGVVPGRTDTAEEAGAVAHRLDRVPPPRSRQLDDRAICD